MGQVPPAIAMASTGGQQDKGAQEAPATVVEQPATIVTPAAMTAQTYPSAAWAVQTEHASLTPVAEVETPAMDGSQPGMIATPQEKVARIDPSTVQATVSEAGQMGGNTVEAS